MRSLYLTFPFPSFLSLSFPARMKLMNDAESRNSSYHDLQSLEREQRERGLREVRERLEQDDTFRPPLSPFVVARPAEERLLYCHHSMYEVRIELAYDLGLDGAWGSTWNPRISPPDRYVQSDCGGDEAAA